MRGLRTSAATRIRWLWAAGDGRHVDRGRGRVAPGRRGGRGARRGVRRDRGRRLRYQPPARQEEMDERLEHVETADRADSGVSSSAWPRPRQVRSIVRKTRRVSLSPPGDRSIFGRISITVLRGVSMTPTKFCASRRPFLVTKTGGPTSFSQIRPSLSSDDQHAAQSPRRRAPDEPGDAEGGVPARAPVQIQRVLDAQLAAP